MAEITLEIAAYERMQSDLEREHMGKWVVVHDEQLLGAYEDYLGRPRSCGSTIWAGSVPGPRSRRRYVSHLRGFRRSSSCPLPTVECGFADFPADLVRY